MHSDGYIDEDTNIANSYLIPIKVDTIDPILHYYIPTNKSKAVTFNQELGLGNKGITTYEQVSREEYGLSNTPI